ncbi:4'-phosphopantetheinyl transferase superfamily protein [Streptomyces sp. NPDC053792]|uniref:4'-phosphopantetheinyl transferase family protein n=1 Tax=Streptomyces sp. NPDC053792 TaxID=3365716 RepID=UPI0037D1BB40
MSGGRADARLLGAVLPGQVRWAEESGEPGPVWLFPEEEALMARAAPGRRREFATARLCAHRALAALGVAAAPLLRGRRGAPAWPAGTVGSITHCAGYRGAAVAPAARFLALGIDAEPHAPLPSGVGEAVAFGPEPARLRALAARRPDIAWDRLLFSAKESVYKAWSGYGGTWLGFEDAEVWWTLGTDDGWDLSTRARAAEAPPRAHAPGPSARARTPGPSPSARTPDPSSHARTPETPPRARTTDPPSRARTERPWASGRFRARIVLSPPAGPPALPRTLRGRWLVRDGLLLTAVAVPRPVPTPHRTAPKEHR